MNELMPVMSIIASMKASMMQVVEGACCASIAPALAPATPSPKPTKSITMQMNTLPASPTPPNTLP